MDNWFIIEIFEVELVHNANYFSLLFGSFACANLFLSIQ